MSRLNDPQNFAGRVAYAAKIIAYGGSPSRAFDNCFENHDGDEVAVVIVRRACRNPKIAANLHRYLDMASVKAAAQRLADVPTRKLSLVARETRARKEAESRAWLEEQDREKFTFDAFSHDPTTEGRA
ncbi:MAG: hypothetical protein H0T56_12265 [Pseudaminobacter sp.]|nr:hypothetical protein [Pseudaminobacter sp.]